MRLSCPYCGVRPSHEFAYLGDAAPRRPDAAAPDAAAAFHAYVYERDNPAGVLEEYWYHAAGCRRWLKARRDTRTHEIVGTDFADPPAPEEGR